MIRRSSKVAEKAVEAAHEEAAKSHEEVAEAAEAPVYPVKAEKSQREYLGVLVTPVAPDVYEFSVFYNENDEQTQEEPFEVEVPGGAAAVNKRAAELLRAKRLRQKLAETAWFVE